MPTPLLKRIYQLPSLTTPATQLAGGYLVWDVPLGPVPGGYKSYKGTAEELAAYLRNQGLLASETAALVATIEADRALVYEAPKGLTQAEQAGLGLAITTAAGTATTLPTTEHLSLASLTSTYDSATGWLYLVLPASIDPANVLSVHLYRQGAVQEQVLAADLFPFGGGSGGSQFLTGTYTVQPSDVTNPASALVIPVPGALVFASVSIEGTGGQGNPLVYGTGYTSQPNVLTIAAGISPALQAGEIIHYSYLKGNVAAPAAGTRSQHSTTQSMRTTGPFIFQTADKPGLLSAVIVDNITTLSAQVNYRDPARPSIWFAGTVRTSASASPADVQTLMAQIYSDIQAIPAASLALAGELLFRTQPLDTTLPANFLLDGAGPFYFLGISRSFRVNYAGPPIGQVLINPQFTNSTDGWNASVQGSWVFGNGSASTVNGNPQGGAFFQRKTVAAGKYEVEYDIDQINLGSARLIVDAGQPYALDTIVTAPGVYKYTIMLPAGSVDVDILNAQDMVVNHIYLTPVP